MFRIDVRLNKSFYGFLIVVVCSTNRIVINILNNAINVVVNVNLISIGSQVSTKDQLLLPRMRYGNAYNMSAIAIHKHKVSQLKMW